MTSAPPRPPPPKLPAASSAVVATTTGAATPTTAVAASTLQQARDLHPGPCDDNADGDDGALEEHLGGLDDHTTIRESASSRPSELIATGSDNADDRDSVGRCSSSCPPRFGDGNEEPGSHLQCCCPGVRISYCKLSQVILAILISAFIVATVVSALS